MTIEDFLDKLEGVTSHGSYSMAFCPSHDDVGQQSLSVSEGEDQRIIIKCHAGCPAGNIVKAMDLTLRDLFPGEAHVLGEPESIYQYVDEQGDALYEAVRMPGKKFRQRHLDPDHPDAKEDGWVWSLEGVRRVLYHLPDVIQAVMEGRGVWIVEGEKDADNLTAAGVTATCNPMGAGKWREEYSQFLQGANVTIIADRDEPGRAHANRVKDMLQPYAANIRVLQSREGKDATDHLEAGLGIIDFVPIRQGPRRGVITSQQLADGAEEILLKNELDMPGYQFLDNCPIIFRPGRMYALGAYTSDGKTRIALQLARRLAEKGVRVGYYSLEMPESDLRNILIQHRGVPLKMLEEPWMLKANPDKLALFHMATEEIAEWHLDIIFNTKVTADFVTSTSADQEHEFVIIDHVHRFNWGGERGKLEHEIQKLTNLSLETNIPVFLLCQLRKTARGRDMIAYPRPSLQEFRETSVIGDDASMALALWRQRDDSGMRFTGGTDLSILKNRHTTSRLDGAGTMFLPNYDIDTQLFSIPTGGMTNGTTVGTHAIEELENTSAGDEWGVWGD